MNYSSASIIKVKERLRAELKEYFDNLTFPEFDFSSDDPAIADPIVDAAGNFIETVCNDITDRLAAIRPLDAWSLDQDSAAVNAAIRTTVGGREVGKAYRDFVETLQGIKSGLDSMEVDDSYHENIEEYLEEEAPEE